MGIFNELGRRLEEFTQIANEAADETAEFQCLECERRFHTEYDECPECGSDAITTRSSTE